jgi:hypothetical protein
MTNQSSDAVNQCGNDPVEIANELREYAGNSGYSHNDYADVMRQAAGMLEAFASIKDQQAQPVEQDGNAVRNAIIDDVVDALSTAYSKASYNEHVDCVEIVQKMKSKPVQPGKLSAPVDQQAHGAMPEPVHFFRQKVGGSWIEAPNGIDHIKHLPFFEFRTLYAAPQAPANSALTDAPLAGLPEVVGTVNISKTSGYSFTPSKTAPEGVYTVYRCKDMGTQNRNTIIERCAEICDGLAKLYNNNYSAFDTGYTMAAERAAKEIRELKE